MKLRHAGNTGIKRVRRISAADLEALGVPEADRKDLEWNTKNSHVIEVPDSVGEKLIAADKKFERVDDADQASSDNVNGASFAPSGDEVANRSDDVNQDDPNA